MNFTKYGTAIGTRDWQLDSFQYIFNYSITYVIQIYTCSIFQQLIVLQNFTLNFTFLTLIQITSYLFGFSLVNVRSV